MDGTLVADERTADRPFDVRVPVRVSDNVAEMCDATLAALAAIDPPPVFQRDRRLVTIGTEGAPAIRGVDRPQGGHFVHGLTADGLRDVVSSHVRFERLRRDRETGEVRAVAEPPPTNVVRAIVSRAEFPLPTLTGIIAAPTMRPDGSILDAPGFDPSTGLYLAACASSFPPVPDAPTRDDAAAAACELTEPFAQFEFARPDEDLAVVVSGILTGVARFAIIGPTPAHVPRAPIRGSGKSLLCSGISLIVTGKPAPVNILARDAEEQRKALFALALEGHGVVLFDNLVGTVGSPVLSAAVTTGEVRDRVLGASAMPSASLRPLWLMNGNGLTFTADFARRVIVADLAPSREDPENRGGFRHPDLLGYVRERRPHLVRAALTILRAYHLAGRPGHGRPAVGSFEAWDALVRGALIWIGLGDPAACRERIREEDDDDLRTVRVVLLAWRGAFGDRRATVAEAIKVAASTPALHEALEELAPADGGRLSARAVGQRMKRLRGRVAAGLKLLGATVGGGAFAYSVAPVGGPDSDKGDKGDSSHLDPARVRATHETQTGGEESPQSPLSLDFTEDVE